MIQDKSLWTYMKLPLNKSLNSLILKILDCSNIQDGALFDNS